MFLMTFLQSLNHINQPCQQRIKVLSKHQVTWSFLKKEKRVWECIYQPRIFLQTRFLISKQNRQLDNLKLVTIFRNIVKSFQIIPLIEDQENRYLVYFFTKKKGTMRQKVAILKKFSVDFFELWCFYFIFWKKLCELGPYTIILFVIGNFNYSSSYCYYC